MKKRKHVSGAEKYLCVCVRERNKLKEYNEKYNVRLGEKQGDVCV